MEITCLICNSTWKSFRSLIKHVNQSHKMSSKEYYDTYLKKETDGVCKECGSKTGFLDIRRGYSSFCSPRCSGKNNIQKGRETCLKNFGVLYGFHKKEVKDQHKIRMLNGQAAYMNSCIKNPSDPQVELFEIVKKIFPDCVLNFPIIVSKDKCYAIDIAIPNLKIAIEHDTLFHLETQDNDTKRQSDIEKLGWSFLRYLGNEVPRYEDIFRDLRFLVELKSSNIVVSEKPWGVEKICINNSNYVVKVIEMKKDHSCSLQYHRFKDETFFLVSGFMKYWQGYDINNILFKILKPGDFLHVYPKTIHRMQAVYEDIVYIETSTNYLDDVVRLEDNYGRK